MLSTPMTNVANFCYMSCTIIVRIMPLQGTALCLLAQPGIPRLLSPAKQVVDSTGVFIFQKAEGNADPLRVCLFGC